MTEDKNKLAEQPNEQQHNDEHQPRRDAADRQAAHQTSPQRAYAEHKPGHHAAQQYEQEHHPAVPPHDHEHHRPMPPHHHLLHQHRVPEHMERHQRVSAETMHEQAQSGQSNEVILRTVLNWVVYVILLFAIYLFWTGHNAPGGGFIAGLMTAGVVVLLYVSFGSSFIHETLKVDFKYVVGVGLTLAVGCGLGGVLFGDPFLTHTFGEFHLPLLGELELATATIFDLGVYLVVTGGCVTIITTIGESDGPQPDDPIPPEVRSGQEKEGVA